MTALLLDISRKRHNKKQLAPEDIPPKTTMFPKHFKREVVVFQSHYFSGDMVVFWGVDAWKTKLQVFLVLVAQFHRDSLINGSVAVSTEMVWVPFDWHKSVIETVQIPRVG